MNENTSREAVEDLIEVVRSDHDAYAADTLQALLDERDHAIKIASKRGWNRSELEQRLRELEAIRAWANSDLERAQPKYGEYAEGLLMAQEVVRAILADTSEGVRAMSSVKVGDRVTWNADGKRLFGDTNPQGIVIAIRDGVEADVRWESNQTTTATLNVLDVIPDA